MRISRIKIENFRGVPDCDIKVRNHLVIVGPNGSGKTRFLSLIDMILSKTRPQITADFNASNPFCDTTSPVKASIVLTDLTSKEEVSLAPHLDFTTSDTAELELSLEASKDPISEEVNVQRGFSNTGKIKTPTPDELSTILWAYLPADRYLKRELELRHGSAFRTLLNSLDFGNSKTIIEEKINSLHDEINSAPALDKKLKEIKFEFAKFFSSSISNSDIGLMLPKADQVDFLRDVEFYLRDNMQSSTSGISSERSFQKQSDGFRSIAVIVLHILAMTYDSILAVDEPETHLHPRAQTLLARRLAERQGQCIIATHSPALLESFSPENVVALTDNTGVRQFPGIPLKANPKLLEHWWTSTKLEPITSNAVILVEGISDRVLVEAVAKALDVDLDGLGITILPVDGAGRFDGFIQLFGEKGFDIPMSGLVDSQEAKDIAKTLSVVKNSKDYNNHNHESRLNTMGFWVAHPDLEGMCINSFGVARHAKLLIDAGLFQEDYFLKQFNVHDISSVGNDILSVDEKSYFEWLKIEIKKRSSNVTKLDIAMAITGNLTADEAKKLATIMKLFPK